MQTKKQSFIESLESNTTKVGHGFSTSVMRGKATQKPKRTTTTTL